MSTETMKLTAVARLLRFGSHDSLPEFFSGAVIDAIAQHITVPSPLVLGVYGVKSSPPGAKGSGEPDPFFPSFSSEFLVVFGENGAVKKLSLTQQSMAPAMDEAIAKAIYAADSAHSFPPISAATDESELAVFIDVDLTDFAARQSYPLFMATVPLYSPTHQAWPTAQAPLPKYPDELRNRRIEGNVVLKFVVDETGRIVDGAYRFMEITEAEFGKAVLAILPNLRYEPARIGNCPVKQLAQQMFEFKIR